MNSAFLVVPFVVVALFALERRFPLRKPKAALAGRLAVNIGLGALVVATSLFVVRPVAAAAWNLASADPFGIVTILPVPSAVGGILAFLLLDLTFYYWHRANHVIPLLWRLHVVHHIDPDLDVTTAYRFHFIEIVLSAGFRGLQVLLIGAPAWAAVSYEVAFQLNSAFQHSNLRLPLRLERWINLLTVTPRMHGIHHSKLQSETNANWSSVFSFWDRLHGTLELGAPQREIDVGIAGYARPEDNRLARTLLMPFEAQRDYWSDDGERVSQEGRVSGAGELQE